MSIEEQYHSFIIETQPFLERQMRTKNQNLKNRKQGISFIGNKKTYKWKIKWELELSLELL